MGLILEFLLNSRGVFYLNNGLSQSSTKAPTSPCLRTTPTALARSCTGVETAEPRPISAPTLGSHQPFPLLCLC